MTMLEKYRNYVIKIQAINETKDDEARLEAYDNIAWEGVDLLEEDFKEQVIDLWEWDLKDSYSKEENRKLIKKNNKCDFIYEVRYSDNKKEFLNEHWNEVDEIISILQKYIKELEKEEAEETKETQEHE